MTHKKNCEGRHTQKKNRSWQLEPVFVWNIGATEPLLGTLPGIIRKKLSCMLRAAAGPFTVYSLYLIASVLLVFLFGYITAKYGWAGYCTIFILSLSTLFLGQNSAAKQKLRVKSDIQFRLIRICDIYEIRNQYSQDLKKGFLGPVPLLSACLAQIPYKPVLFTAYAIIIFAEQILSFGFSVQWLNELFAGSYGIKYIAVSFLAIDRAVTLLNAEAEKAAAFWQFPKHNAPSAYEPVFLESHFYLLDSYMAGLTKGEILIAAIDPDSPAYKAGVRRFDIIASVNGQKATLTVLQTGLRMLRETGAPLTLKIVTAESDYKQSVIKKIV